MSRDYRIRFDDEFDDLIDAMKSTELFVENSEIALFAGSLGLSRSSSRTRAKGTKDVRLSVFFGVAGGMELLNLVGLAIEFDDSPDPLADSAIDRRLALLEGYVNGGLEILKAITDSGRSLPLSLVEIYSSEFESITKESDGK